MVKTYPIPLADPPDSVPPAAASAVPGSGLRLDPGPFDPGPFDPGPFDPDLFGADPSDPLEIGRRLTADPQDPGAVAAALADCALALPADVCGVWLTESDAIRPVAVRHGQDSEPDLPKRRLLDPRIAPVQWAVGELAADRLPVVLSTAGLRTALALAQADPLLVCPLPARDQGFGLLAVGRRSESALQFRPQDAHRLEFLARMAGSALNGARGWNRVRAQAGLVEAVSDPVVATDAAETVVSWNRAAERVYGIPACEAIGEPLAALLRSDFDGALDAGQAREHALRHGSWRGRVRQSARSGVVVEVESSVSVWTDEAGRPAGLVAINRDLTELLAARAAAELQARYTQELMDALDDRAAVIDTSGRVRAVNARWTNGLADRAPCVLGPVPLGQSWLNQVRAAPGEDVAAFAASAEAVLSGELSGARLECRCPEAGADRATGIEVAELPGAAAGAVVVLSDVSWRRRLQDELSHRATHDELTGLPNRVSLREVLDRSLDGLDGQRMLAVLFCDLDGFKDVNDGLGHAVGDQVLVAVARRLRQRCRSADVVARFGGDEFVVVLTIPDPSDAVAMAERIVEVLSEPVVIGDAEVAPGVSIGITVVSRPPEGEDPAGTLLRDADTAMYQAKERGRGRYEFFDAGLRENIERRVELSAALHRAAQEGELRLRYQTRRECGTRTIAGVEALLQWQHPHLGLVRPETFIPIAERNGRIVEVGGWALDRALSEFAKVAESKLTVAVNVSPRQLSSPKLPGSIDQALASSGLDPSRLVLEITEGALVDDPTAARTVLTDLRNLGVVIALDDFGTGWSSLSYLRTLPVDVIKIDRTFVADLPTDLDACAVVSAVLNLGHGMGLVVVAEGVEREDQLAVLRDMGCDEYQGFIDGLPGPLDLVLR
jgi:diguanylate cyclase (GGDEF)-like protein/PAS domain S-box-containing protein